MVTWRRAQMVLLSAQGMDAAAIAKVAAALGPALPAGRCLKLTC